MPDGLDLLVVGGPTHGYGTSARLRAWLGHLESASGINAAAFDTRYELARVLTGSAARVIDPGLRQRGFRLVRRPESFFVARRAEGPLLPGEEERAADWASGLAAELAAAAASSAALTTRQPRPRAAVVPLPRSRRRTRSWRDRPWRAGLFAPRRRGRAD
jgi:hypothetical protein